VRPPHPPARPVGRLTPAAASGTPTSTTTSLSALSTTAIKDGHRGHALPTTSHRGHHHHASTNSLEAERADRISRLTGLSGVNTLRPPHAGPHGGAGSTQSTPTSAAAPPAAFFDSNGQPTAATKISTVGTASATESLGRRTLGEGDEDLMSLDTNPRDTEADSVSGYTGAGAGDVDPVDEDLASRSAGGYDDRMSDDGEASLVGFGEGAGSTVSGPIYHRRPVPGSAAAAWGLERSSSGLSDGAARRDAPRASGADRDGTDTPVSATAVLERLEARAVDGVATDGVGATAAPADGGMFVDTTTRAPVPVQPTASAIRETQQPQSFQQQQQQRLHNQQLRQQQQQQQQQLLLHQALQQQPSPAAAREALERIVSGLDDGESRVGGATLSSPGKGGGLGRFYFEDPK